MTWKNSDMLLFVKCMSFLWETETCSCVGIWRNWAFLYLRFHGELNSCMQLHSKLFIVAPFHDCGTWWVTWIDGYAIVQDHS
jgi:hypothetical protein